MKYKKLLNPLKWFPKKDEPKTDSHLSEAQYFKTTDYPVEKVHEMLGTPSTENSINAYESVKPRIEHHGDQIMYVLRTFGSKTAEEISQYIYSIDAVGVSRRMSELRKAGKVVEGGVRKNQKGNNCTVWEAVV